METNVGGQDRLFRAGVGFLSFAIAYASDGGLLLLVFGLIAFIGLGTSLTGYCPINHRLGVNTASKKPK